MAAFDTTDSRLLPLWEKIIQEKRLTPEEGLLLYATDDITALGKMADMVRARKNGNVATFLANRYINYSNICILNCQFCAFAAKKRDPHAYEMSIPEIIAQAREAAATGATEIHMVGGLHPTLPDSWYLELLQAIQKEVPTITIKAFTAVEIRHLSRRIFKKPIPETLQLLKEAGLASLTGGGAEIFNQEVRDQICRGKETAEEWLDIHRTWHKMGMKSTATMLFGHIETAADRIDHLNRLRQLQDETGGFTALIPYAFVPETTILSHIVPASDQERLRNIAIARLYLDNFPHITAYWISMGLDLAAEALHYGADDLHGTIHQEKIFHMAGAKTPQEQSRDNLKNAILGAGLIPAQRNTFYEHIA